MRYKVYELVKPEHLQKTEPDGYHIKTIERNVLEELDYSSGLENEYNSVESAMQDIEENKHQLKHRNLTILPVISVGWDANLY